VYFHKSTRAGETMIRAILRRAVELVAEGERLPATIPLLEAAAAGLDPTLEQYLEIDDLVLLGAIRAWESAKDPVLADLSKRLARRHLWKTLELGGVESDASPEQALGIAESAARERGLDPRYYVALDRASDVPYPADAELRVISPDGRARDLSQVSFLLGRLKGERLSRTRLVFAPELREQLRQALAG
jgi:HD superfamily phosphohydrolase